MMKISLCAAICCCLCHPLVSQTPQPSSHIELLSKLQNPQEALMLRRVVEFWQEGEDRIAQKEIEKYLQKADKGFFAEYLHALLADLYLKQEKYTKSLEHYNVINDPILKQNCIVNYLDCLYSLEDYKTLADEAMSFDGNPVVISEEDEEHVFFYFAEGLYRYALQTPQAKKEAIIAKKYYQALLSTQYSDEAMKGLAALHHYLGEHKPASSLYLKLAEKDAAKKEDFLFQAALLQSEFDDNLAVETFRKLANMHGKKSYQAAYHCLLILFKNKQYQKIYEEREIWKENLAKEYATEYYFLIGRVAYHLENYQTAIANLQKFLKRQEGSDPETRTALLTLMQSASIRNDEELFEEALTRFVVYFPKDSTLPQTLWQQGRFHIEKQEYDKALALYQKVTEEWDDFNNREAFLWELASLLEKKEDMEGAKNLLKQILVEYPNFVKRKQCFENLIAIINEQLRLCAKEDKTERQHELINTIEQYLHEGIAQVDQISKYHFAISQAKFSLGLYDDLVKEVPIWTEKDHKSSYAKQGLYLLALSYQKLGHHEEFVFWANKLLENPCKEIDTPPLLISLFNTYIHWGEDHQNLEEKKKYFDQAADALFVTFKKEPTCISQENLFWLVQYYYNNTIDPYLPYATHPISSKEKEYQSLLRAKILLESLLLTDRQELNIKLKQLEIEPYQIMLAHLYYLLGDQKSHRDLLHDLIVRYKNSPRGIWHYPSHAYFMMGHFYEESGDYPQAIENYTCAVDINSDKLLSSTAALYRARLRLQGVERGIFTEKQANLKKDLSRIKDLCIRKRWETEPLHLQAALTYVDIMSFLEKEHPHQKRYELLSRLKKSFTEENDIISKDYQLMRQKMPENEKVFRSYIAMMDLELLNSEYHMLKENNSKKAFVVSQKFKVLLKSFLDEKKDSSSYLENRVKKFR